MKITITARSQEEFNAKRANVIKAIAGKHMAVSSRVKGQNTSTTSTIPYYRAQDEMLEHWDSKFRKMLSDLKNEIDEIIG